MRVLEEISMNAVPALQTNLYDEGSSIFFTELMITLLPMVLIIIVSSIWEAIAMFPKKIWLDNKD